MSRANVFKKAALACLIGALACSVQLKTHAAPTEYFSKNLYCTDLPTALDQYACLTEHAAQGIELNMASNRINATPAQSTVLRAIEAMNLVQTIAGSGRYMYVKRTQKDFKPPTGTADSPFNHQPDICLTNAFGICGNHQFLFIAVLNRLGIEARPVDFYYSINGRRLSHAAAEVKTGKNWAFFDITWGSYWLNSPRDLISAVSLDDVLKGKGIQKINNNSWYVATTYSFSLLGLQDVFSYLHAHDVQILKNKGGTLLLTFQKNQANLTEQPNYFGTLPNNAPLKIKLPPNIPPTDAMIDIAGIGGDCNQSLMKIGLRRYPIIRGASRVHIAPNDVIEIEGKDKVCYATLSGLKIKME